MMTLSDAHTIELMECVDEVKQAVTSKIPGSDDFASEAINNAILEVARYRPAIRNIKPYLFKSAYHRTLLDLRETNRQQTREVPVDAIDPTLIHRQHRHSDLADEFIRIWNRKFRELSDATKLEWAMEVMSEEEITIFRMRAECISYAEIETVTGRSASSLRQMVCRVRLNLRQRLAALGNTLLGIRIPVELCSAPRVDHHTHRRVFRVI